MIPHQLQNLPCVAHSPIREQEEEPWVTLVHWLPEDPLERGEDVGAAHVSPYSLDAVTCHGQVLLQGRTMAEQTGPRFTTWHGVSKCLPRMNSVLWLLVHQLHPCPPMGKCHHLQKNENLVVSRFFFRNIRILSS